MAKNRYRVTDEKLILIFRLNKHCHDQRTIAKAVNLSQGTVSKILSADKVEKVLVEKPNKKFDWKDFNNSIIF